MIKPIEGTEILFCKDGVWFNMNSSGEIVSTHTAKYFKRYKLRNSLVVVADLPSDLNGEAITVVVDKDKINKPDLLSFEFTTEWMSLEHFLQLKKMTDAFCVMAKTFYIPSK